MKRYEKMSKEEIVDLFVNGCSKCGAKEDCIAENCEINCRAMKKEWLNKDIETKPRWATIKSNEHLEDIQTEFNLFCNKNNCDDCRLNNNKSEKGVWLHCYTRWLEEEVEV